MAAQSAALPHEGPVKPASQLQGLVVGPAADLQPRGPNDVPTGRHRLPSEARSTSSGSSSSSEVDEEEASSGEGTIAVEEPVAALAAPTKVQLFKLGQLCCDAVAEIAGGNRQPEQLVSSLQIDQRATLDRCREHVEWAGDLTTIWELSVPARGGRRAYEALCEYFVAKQRVGLVETPTYAIYIVPPNEKYFKEIGLDGAGSKHIVGLQIPTATG